MIQSVAGVYRDGKIELFRPPENIKAAQVIVTFLPDSHESGSLPVFTSEELAELRDKLAAWEDDWNAPGMEAYDDYEARRRGSRAVPPQ